MKSKFNKSKCRKCIYGNTQSISVICTYSTRNKDMQTCLYRGDDRKIHDRRGDDYDNCLLFKEGKQAKSYEW